MIPGEPFLELKCGTGSDKVYDLITAIEVDQQQNDLPVVSIDLKVSKSHQI